MTEDFGVSQYPGGFFFFWNVFVPLTVFLNIKKFGFRKHEAGLLIALSLNPYVLQFITRNVLAATAVMWFLILCLEGILSRWIWYQIYTLTFLKHTLFFLAGTALPALLLQIVWNPLICILRAAAQSMVERDTASTAVDALMMLAVSFFLLRVIMSQKFDFSAPRKRCKDKKSVSK